MTRPRILAAAACALIAVGYSISARAAALDAAELRLLQDAKPTNQDVTKALELAKKLGSAASVEGLEAILQAGNRHYVGSYAYGFTFASVPVLSPELEALMVRHFGTGDNHYAFMRMIGEGRAKYRSRAMFDAMVAALDKGIEDRTFASGRAQSMMQAIVKTDQPEIEAPVFERLPKLLDASRMGSIAAYSWTGYGIAVEFLARRKYTPAAAYLSGRLQQASPDADPQKSEAALVLAALGRIDPEEAVRAASARLDQLSLAPSNFAVGTEMRRAFEYLRGRGVPIEVAKLQALLRGRNPNDPLAASVIQALIRTPQKEAIDIVIDRLAWAGAQTSPPPLEVEQTLAALAALGDQTLLDYARLRKALPAGISDRAVSAHLKLIERRKEAQAVPDLIAYLPRAQGGEALGLIVESDSVEVWRQARAGLELLQRGQMIDASRYATARARLDEIIADPDKHFAAKRQRQLAQAYEEDKRKIDSLGRDTERWIAAAEELQVKYAGLPAAGMLRGQIRSAYVRLAANVRFVQKQPLRAIALYEEAARHEDEARARFLPFLTDILIGDTYQFDLRAPKKALQHYEAALAAVQAQGGPMEKGVAAPWLRFLRHEIAYLRTGARFAGTLTKEDVLGFLGAAVVFGYSDLAAALPAQGAPLESLPPTRLSLPAAMAALTAQRDPAAILRYLDKHDPSGYWSACLLGLVPYIDAVLKRDPNSREARELEGFLPDLSRESRQASGLRSASAKFLSERKVSLHLPAPDPRKSSPEKTWQLFMASLGRGDLETAYACMTPRMREKIEPRLSRMPKDALKDMAQSFSGFAVSETTGELREAMVRRGDRAGFVYFFELDGEWKIEEM